MNYLYIIGGSARSGKTTVLNKVIIARPMIAIQTDAIREGLRQALIGESLVTISKISFSGDVTFQSLQDNKDLDITKHFSREMSQDDLTWNTVVGLINYYDDKNVNLVVEGIEITPERVNGLVLKKLKARAVFVGITGETNLNTILEKANTRHYDTSIINERFNEEVEKSKRIAIDANRYGYKFFPFNNDDFDGYCDNVVNYLLE